MIRNEFLVKNKHFEINTTNLVFNLFEIENGVIGVKRDVFFQLIELMHFRKDEIIQNVYFSYELFIFIQLFGMSVECFEWISHPYFPYHRNPKPNLKRLMIRNKFLVKNEDFEINTTNLVFCLVGTGKCGSLFINILIKEMIFEWLFFFFSNLDVIF
jgi:hypothetical protein